MARFKTTGNRNSGMNDGNGNRQSQALIDTLTAEERGRLAELGYDPSRKLTKHSAEDLRALFEQEAGFERKGRKDHPQPVRELADSLGTVMRDGVELPVCDPCGKLAQVFTELMTLRTSESKALGSISRLVKKWRIAGSMSAAE